MPIVTGSWVFKPPTYNATAVGYEGLISVLGAKKKFGVEFEANGTVEVSFIRIMRVPGLT